VNINQATINLVKEFEGCKLEAYQDIVGVWTIGYGTTEGAGLGVVPKPGMKITQEEAELLLMAGLKKFAEQIKPKFMRQVNDNQFGALLSLAYNIGPSAFSRSSALMMVNEGQFIKAADAIRLWNKAGGKMNKGLVRRREAERTLFLTPTTLVVADMHPQESTQVKPKRSFTLRTLAALFGVKK
jgi:GH24 family phage-related lysozyme (muramidase)